LSSSSTTSTRTDKTTDGAGPTSNDAGRNRRSSTTEVSAAKPSGGEESRHWSNTGFEIAAVYEPAGGAPSSIGLPGEFPFTRHIYPTGYRTRPWAPSLYSGFGTPEDANRRFRYLLSLGNGRANIATDLPTQIGLDSDDPDAEGEVGRVGVAIDSLADFEIMFDQVPLDRTAVSLNLNTTAPIFLAMLVSTARRQGVDLDKVSGTLANDILHEYVARGTWRYPPESALRLMADVAEYATHNMRRFYPFNIRSILLHESGAHPGQEIGFTFAMACRYVEELLARDLDVDAFAPRMSFFFGMGLRLFEEAAKFRAARRMWASIMRDRYGARSDSSLKLRLTSVAPCGSHFTAVDPELNLVRGTLGVLAGALGGVQAMLGTTIDEAYDIPTERTQHLALRTQQIVALESDVCATVDPLGGSWFVESMTDRIEQSARRQMNLLGGPQGVVQAIQRGLPQSELGARAYELERELADGTRPKVGVNVHRAKEQTAELKLHVAEPELHRRRAEDLSALRRRRDSGRVADALAGVEDAARTGANVIGPMIDAVEAYATVGEISSALDDVFGGYVQPAVL
jgi:methylmalonyl-CoA mutase, N-terminal domain